MQQNQKNEPNTDGISLTMTRRLKCAGAVRHPVHGLNLWGFQRCDEPRPRARQNVRRADGAGRSSAGADVDGIQAHARAIARIRAWRILPTEFRSRTWLKY